MTDRKTANISAGIVFAVVLVVGAWLFGGNHSFERPTTTTVVVKSAAPATSGVQESKHVVVAGKGKAKTTTTTTTRTKSTAPAEPQSTETTTVTGGRSFVERILGDKGVIFLQIGVILLAAFIAGAATQRVLMGQFGGFKLGALEINELADVSDKTVQELTSLAKHQQEFDSQLTALKTELKAVLTQLTKADERSDTLDLRLNERLRLITTKLAQLESQAGPGAKDE